MTQVHWITTTDTKRLRQWERIFGTAVLPVLHSRARFIFGEDGHSRPMHDLALKHLTDWQRFRLAREVSRQTARPYADVLREIQTRPSYLIPAANCRVVVLEDSPAKETAVRPSLLISSMGMYDRLAMAA